MRRGNCNNNFDQCCPDPCEPGGGCKMFSSRITYDGADIPELCVKSGTPLNDVIAVIGRVVKTIQRAAIETITEEFDGLQEGSGSYYLQLEMVPSEILMVVHGGGVLPTDAYKSSGKNLYFSKKYCLGACIESEVKVVYRSKYADGFNVRC